MAVRVWVHAPSTHTLGERVWPRDAAWDEVCARIERVTGVPPAAQRLSLYASHDLRDGQPSGAARALPTPPLAPDAAPLAAWGVQDGMLLRVDDARGAALPDDVEKYEMSDEAYAARRDSVRAFKQAHQLGRFAPAAAARAAEPARADLVVGARCEVARDASFARRGTIAYVGPAAFAPGTWVGVVYDEPVGKNDGSVQGERYFTARPHHGGMVRPAMVTVGDFPEDWSDEER
ncbi:hypothetical protein MBRA1_003708 [Malassezia brasiliensis]|uniref:CAP-Gly domain-containing protein n=1 Tax=Malassezia brasiliensis TaxID=1821822 RepID=A0AAF0DWD9_9BASI|nr:hypothetical protein MBRA1_003708 [Malassezia brasiliensis]